MAQYLNYLTGRVKPIRFGVYDIESQDWINPILVGFFDGLRYHEFRTVTEYVNFLHEYKTRYYIYAHFGSGYDHRFILDDIDKRDISSNIMQINNKILAINCEIGNSEFQFRDSFNLMPQPLAKISKAFAPEYEKIEVDIQELVSRGYSKELSEYLEYDNKGLYYSIKRFQDMVNDIGGKVKLTLPSTALDIYRRNYFPKYSLWTEEDLNEVIRVAYFGGRTEVFQRSGENLFYYDFTSLYPSVMIEKMPVGNPLRVNRRLKDNEIGFSYITVTIPESLIIPPIPVRTKKRGLVYPTGTISGLFAKPFINLLDFLNIPYKVDYSFVFSADYIFNEYIEAFFSMKNRSEKNSAEYIIAKFFLNTLYGKFAERKERVKSYIRPSFEDIKKKKLKPINRAFDLWEENYEKFNTNTIVWIGAYITALAQEKLFFKMVEAGDVYYCDTDSIITSHKFESKKELGALELEHEIYQFYGVGQKVYGIKDYKGELHLRVKGFPSKEINANKEYWWRAMKIAVEDNDLSAMHMKYKALYGFRESLKSERVAVYFGEKTKSLINPETKRRFNGRRTYPLNVNELELI